MTVTWDPSQYLRFARFRERPYEELVARMGARDPGVIVDLGCGPGTATARLSDHWPAAHVLGVDSSPEMIERAGDLARPARLDFVLGDLQEWLPAAPVDVIVCNAVLQWVPRHEDLLGRFVDWLVPGGVLAFQVPANFDTPIHTELRRLLSSGRWSVPMTGLLRDEPVRTAAEYLSRLLACGTDPDVWETTYMQVLPGPDGPLEWARGTALRPVLSALEPADSASFEEAYREALRAAYPPDEHGRSVLPFRRIFAVATKPEPAAEPGSAGGRRLG